MAEQILTGKIDEPLDTTQATPQTAQQKNASDTSGLLVGDAYEKAPKNEFEQRIENYRPQAAELAKKMGADYFPEIPIISPLALRIATATGSILGFGEGDTFYERYQNELAKQQALEEERQKLLSPVGAFIKGAGNIVAGIATLPELGAEAAITKLGASTVAKYAAPAIEAGLYGGASNAAETIPGESWQDYAKRTGEGAAWGSALGAGLKGVFWLGGKAYQFAKPTVQTIFNPEAGAISTVAQAAEGAAPSAASKRGISVDEFTQRALAGQDVNIADIQGVKPVLERAAGRAEPSAVDALNDSLSQRLKDSGQAVGAGLDAVYGKTLDAGASRDAAITQARAVNKPAYDKAYSQPIDYASPQGMQIENIINNRVPSTAIKRANDLMRTEGASPSQQIMANIADDGSVTFQKMPNTMQVDYITRALNDMAKSGEGAGAMGGQTQLGSAYQGLARDLRTSLRQAVPDYGTAVDGAGRYIKQNNAFDSGTDFIKLITNKKADPTDVSNQLRMFTRRDGKQYSPKERATFSEGIANFIKENPDTAAKIFAQGDSTTMQRMQTALGSQNFNAIDDLLSANRIAAMTKEIGAKTPPGILHDAGVGTAIGAAGGTALEHFVPTVWQNITSNPLTAAGAAALAAGGIGLKAGMNAIANRRANALLQLALSDQPTAAQKLIDATKNNAQNRAALHDLEERAARYLGATYGLPENRLERKSGGRVSDTEDAASHLVREAERTKNLISNHTERMLSLPDDAVVNALSVAKSVF